MEPIEAPDSHHLCAAVGWLELGNYQEAEAELKNIAPELRVHPAVLELRWRIYAVESKWDACRETALMITQVAPECESGWLHLSYSTRRASGGSVQSAWEILLPIADKFPHVPMIQYNLACYACQLGYLESAKAFLTKAFSVGESAKFKTLALNDPDLEPLWANIGNIN